MLCGCFGAPQVNGTFQHHGEPGTGKGRGASPAPTNGLDSARGVPHGEVLEQQQQAMARPAAASVKSMPIQPAPLADKHQASLPVAPAACAAAAFSALSISPPPLFAGKQEKLLRALMAKARSIQAPTLPVVSSANQPSHPITAGEAAELHRLATQLPTNVTHGTAHEAAAHMAELRAWLVGGGTSCGVSGRSHTSSADPVSAQGVNVSSSVDSSCASARCSALLQAASNGLSESQIGLGITGDQVGTWGPPQLQVLLQLLKLYTQLASCSTDVQAVRPLMRLLLRPQLLQQVVQALELVHFSNRYQAAAGGKLAWLPAALQLWSFLQLLVRLAVTYEASVDRLDDCLRCISSMLTVATPSPGIVPRLLAQSITEDNLAVQVHILQLLQLLYGLREAGLLQQPGLAEHYVLYHQQQFALYYDEARDDAESACAELCRMHLKALRSLGRLHDAHVRTCLVSAGVLAYLLRQLCLEAEVLCSQLQLQQEQEDLLMLASSEIDSEGDEGDEAVGSPGSSAAMAHTSSAISGQSANDTSGNIGAASSSQPSNGLPDSAPGGAASSTRSRLGNKPSTSGTKSSIKFEFKYDLNEDFERLMAMEEELGCEIELTGLGHGMEGGGLPQPPQALALRPTPVTVNSGSPASKPMPALPSLALRLHLHDDPNGNGSRNTTALSSRSTAAEGGEAEPNTPASESGHLSTQSLRRDAIPKLSLASLRTASTTSVTSFKLLASSPMASLTRPSLLGSAAAAAAASSMSGLPPQQAQQPLPHASASARQLQLPSHTSGSGGQGSLQPGAAGGSSTSRSAMSARSIYGLDSSRSPTVHLSSSITAPAMPTLANSTALAASMSATVSAHGGSHSESMQDGSHGERTAMESARMSGGRASNRTSSLLRHSSLPVSGSIEESAVYAPNTAAGADAGWHRPSPGRVPPLAFASSQAVQLSQDGLPMTLGSIRTSPSPACSARVLTSVHWPDNSPGGAALSARVPGIPALNLAGLNKKGEETNLSGSLSSALTGGAATTLGSSMRVHAPCPDSAADTPSSGIRLLGSSVPPVAVSSRQQTDGPSSPLAVQKTSLSYATLASRRLLYNDSAVHMSMLQLVLDLLLTPAGLLDPAYVTRFQGDGTPLSVERTLAWHLSSAAGFPLVPQLMAHSGSSRAAAGPIATTTLTPAAEQHAQTGTHAIEQSSTGGCSARASLLTPLTLPAQLSGQHGALTSPGRWPVAEALPAQSSPPLHLAQHSPPGKGTGLAADTATTPSSAIVSAVPNATARLLRLLCRPLFDAEAYVDLQFQTRGAYGGIFKAKRLARPPPTDFLNSSNSCTVAVHSSGGAQAVVIKTIDLPASVYDGCILPEVLAEVSILERYKGVECICQLLDYGLHNDAYWIVLKRYRCSLSEWRARQRTTCATPAAALLYLRILAEVVHALSLLAADSIVHFDLKCANILVDPLPGVKDGELWGPTTSTPQFKVALADFGEARAYRNAAEAFTARNRGTEVFKSPEMLLINSSARPGGSRGSTPPTSQQRSAMPPTSAGDASSGNSSSAAATVSTGTSGCIGGASLGSGAAECNSSGDQTEQHQLGGAGLASDVWSLGCLAFELLTGQVLFGSADYASVTHRVAFGPGDNLQLNATEKCQLGGCNEAVALIEWILARDPVRRPTPAAIAARVSAVMVTLAAQL